jgi:hypothetical protein
MQRDLPNALDWFVRVPLSHRSPDIPAVQPIGNAPSPFTFAWTDAARLTIVAGPQNVPVFPFSWSERDQVEWLEACRKQLERLLKDLRDGRFNVRSDYRDALERYDEDLPTRVAEGNFMLADSEARTIRNLFQADAESLPTPFSSRLRVFLECHIALRNFYPETGRFYIAVRKGRLDQSLPQDAVEGFTSTVREHTPDIFAGEISSGLRAVEAQPPAIAIEPVAPRSIEHGVIVPPPDPLGELKPEHSRSFLTASSVNSLYRAFLKGKDLSNAVAGWSELAHKLAENAGPIIDWLRTFMTS